MSFVHTTEFFVIMTIVAAAIVALCARPARRGAVREHLLAGVLDAGTGGELEPAALHIRCLANGDVWILRTGYDCLGSTGAVSLAVSVKRFDVDIRERITPGQLRWGDEPLTQAAFELDFLAPEWYHVKYTDDATGLFAAFSLHVRPGLQMTVPLHR